MISDGKWNARRLDGHQQDDPPVAHSGNGGNDEARQVSNYFCDHVC